MVSTTATRKGTEAGSGESRAKQKRRRATTSCVDCHRRKQKCDRGTPCTNCIIRGNQSRCHYLNQPLEALIGARSRYETIIKLRSSSSSKAEAVIQEGATYSIPKDTVDKVNELGFSETNPDTSFGMFKALNSSNTERLTQSRPLQDQQTTMTRWYTSCLRQLPSLATSAKLVASFFESANWQYNPLDYETFLEQKSKWDQLSYAELAKGPNAIDLDTRYFPATLFHVLALALVHWDSEDDDIESLKYKSDMSLEDVAHEYSEAGVTLSRMLSGPKDISTSAVQAGYLRTLFLKATGNVSNCWDYLGETILWARQLGWHLDVTAGETSVGVAPTERACRSEVAKRIWLNLCCWDAHMSTLLGRPMRTTMEDMETPGPTDTFSLTNRNQSASFPRNRFDLPTRLTIQLMYRRVASFLVRGAATACLASPSDRDDAIQELHDEIIDFREHLPSFLWIEFPNTAFDQHPDCLWLVEARQSVESIIWFAVLALHRPRSFKSKKSRGQALMAGLRILESQKQIGQGSKYRHYLYLFRTFDALVTVAAIYVGYPAESPRHLERTMEHISGTIPEFESMGRTIPLAVSAASVLKALYARLQKIAHTPMRLFTHSPTYPRLVNSATAELQPQNSTWDVTGLDPADLLPFEYSFNAVPPPSPFHDLLDNRLSGVNSDMNTAGVCGTNQAWQFYGNFDNDTFWNVMNQTKPSQDDNG